MSPTKPLLAATATLLLAASLDASAAGEQPSEMAVLRNTVVNLLDAMVKQGLISREAAEKLVADAQSRAASEVSAAATADAPAPGDVRVTYVPQVVRDEITAQVKQDLQASMVADVKKAAADEGWGVPAALPSWVRSARWSGDIRVRGEYTALPGDNGLYPDFQAINDAGGEGPAGADALLNTTSDQVRYQLKAGFGGLFDLDPHAVAAIRFGTGNRLSPVTRNQVLGDYDRTFPLLLEEAYLRLGTAASEPQHQLLFWAGRTPNLFQSTELVWDSDVRLNGFTFQYAWNNPQVTGESRRARGFFATAGAYPLQEVELSTDDKWLLAGQLGWEFDPAAKVRVSFAAAYYDYLNITGRANAPSSDGVLDYTAPEFLQKGNTVFDIRADADPDTSLYALAADYNLLDLTATAGWTLRPDLVLDLTANYVTNIGYDYDEVVGRTGCKEIPGTTPDDPPTFVCPVEKADGYRLEVRLGNPDIARPLAWRAFAAYHYAERDAVLDAFTDSDFHRGGTDAEGFIIGGELGLTRNTWLRLRYLSADEIDGPPLAVDVLQLDLNGKF
ncbi:MAG: putative porin [Gammaproteobacteria bacterium]|nr:putative porin [Gammaproteobacteria bacterium]